MEKIIEEINRLKKEKNAIILAHYYANDEVQDIADYLGDSYKLAMDGANSDAKIIVFAGVNFMGESAKILSPEKKVLMPNLNAGCKMADMIDSIKLSEYKKNNPNTKIISYVNTTANVKALSDCCCTSVNALKIIKYYTDLNYDILYCPDQNLGKYAMDKFGKTFDVWTGFCPMHHDVDYKDVIKLKEEYKDALLVVHPECQKEVVKLADFVGSTKQILEFVKTNPNKRFIVSTEVGIIHQLKKDSPDKEFIIASNSLYCSDMKLNTLESIRDCLKYETNEIILDETVSKNAKKALDEMFRITNL